mmetsp:Transcript_16694/g.42749  ORF Transcript_16694/g.42749 Transcript_16694/m.42749 type:complete len:208 (-) Transcript_16694:97-720(-)
MPTVSAGSFCATAGPFSAILSAMERRIASLCTFAFARMASTSVVCSCVTESTAATTCGALSVVATAVTMAVMAKKTHTPICRRRTAGGVAPLESFPTSILAGVVCSKDRANPMASLLVTNAEARHTPSGESLSTSAATIVHATNPLHGQLITFCASWSTCRSPAATLVGVSSILSCVCAETSAADASAETCDDDVAATATPPPPPYL